MEPKSLKERLIMYIVSCNTQRKTKIMKMIEDLSIPYDYVIFEAHTPADSKDYINYRDSKIQESDNLICCSRSHISAIRSFSIMHPEKDLVLILEDDVRFIKTGFEKELEEVVNMWAKHEDEIDFVNIGYLLKESKSLKSDGILHWSLAGPGGALWGAQAYLIKRPIAEKMASILHQPSSKDLYDAVFNYLYTVNKGVAYANKAILLSPDYYLSICWRQGYVKPMLAIEDNDLESTIFAGQINGERKCLNKFSDIRDYNDFYKFN